MGNQRQRIDALLVDQHIDAHHIGSLKTFEVVIQRGVTARGRLQTVKEVEHHFRHRNLIGQRDLVAVVDHVGLHAALLDAERDDIAQILLRQQHMTLGDRLAQLFDIVQRRQLRGAVDIDDFAASSLHFVHYGRRGGDQIEIVFALQALLNDLHMQQTQEAAAEAEAERGRAFRLIEQRGVVQAQLAERVAEGFVVVRADREQTGIDLRLHFFEARQRFIRRIARQRQGIAHRRAKNIFDGADQPAHFAAVQLRAVNLLRREDAEAIGVIDLTGAHHFDFVAFAQRAVFHADQRDHAKVVIEPGVDNQRLQRTFRIAFRRRNIAHQTLQHFRHADAGFRRAAHRIGSVDADDIFNLLRRTFRIGGRQIDFIQYRHNFQIHLDRGVAVRQGLRFYALSCVHHQQRAFARRQRARYFIGEVDVPWGIDEIELVSFAVERFVIERHALRFDSNAALALQVH